MANDLKLNCEKADTSNSPEFPRIYLLMSSNTLCIEEQTENLVKKLTQVSGFVGTVPKEVNKEKLVTAIDHYNHLNDRLALIANRLLLINDEMNRLF